MVTKVTRALRRVLPTGRPLPEPDWRARHRVILLVLALHAVGIFVYGLCIGYGIWHSAVDAAPVAIAAGLGASDALGRRLRSSITTLGLLTASAMLVHLSGGMIEFHFHFFVMLFVITIYQDWLAFLLAIGFVVVEHAVLGVLAPHAVYNHEGAWEHPIRFALLHAAFITAAAVAAIANWRLTELAQAATQTLAAKLSYEASHDMLTGALNRREFERRLSAILDRPNRAAEAHALCLMDLDRFKIVNDSCGHAAGDVLLKEITEVLRRNLRDADELFRIGGDEFALLLTGCTVDQAEEVAQRLRQAVGRYVFIDHGRAFNIGVSIGVVTVPTGPVSAEDLMRSADAACYTAKHQGRDRVQVYRAGDGGLDRQRDMVHWSGEVMAALRDNRLELYYQPIVDVDGSGGATFGELLLRLRTLAGEIVGPGAFLAAAEHYDLMSTVDRWVVDTAFSILGDRYATDPTATDVFFINLSGSSMGDDTFLAYVTDRLAAHRVPPGIVCFEVTETVAIKSLDTAFEFITRLRAAGCRFALDDFGTGLSSFQYLKSLPVDFVKIDGNFVRGIADDPIDRAIVEAVNRVGHEAGLATIAEFVEDTAILAELSTIGVDYAQGYGIARPGPLAQWLRDQRLAAWEATR